LVSSYTATIRWSRDSSTDFAKGQYSRARLFVIANVAKQSSPALVALDCRVAFGSSQ
jgi:hypothetical protein